MSLGNILNNKQTFRKCFILKFMEMEEITMEFHGQKEADGFLEENGTERYDEICIHVLLFTVYNTPYFKATV